MEMEVEGMGSCLKQAIQWLYCSIVQTVSLLRTVKERAYPKAVRARNISFSNSDSSLKPGNFSNFQWILSKNGGFSILIASNISKVYEVLKNPSHTSGIYLILCDPNTEAKLFLPPQVRDSGSAQYHERRSSEKAPISISKTKEWLNLKRQASSVW